MKNFHNKGSSDAALDTSWLFDAGYNLAVGYQKQFKIFDIRESRDGKFCSLIYEKLYLALFLFVVATIARILNSDAKSTNAVGLSVDPLNHNRLATYTSLESQKVYSLLKFLAMPIHS